jgi:hypothetical protein
MSDRWPALRRRLAALLPGVDLAQWADLDPELRTTVDAFRATRTAYLAATHRALVVAALRRPDMRREVTPGVLAEVEAFTAQARPVLAFTGRRLVAWPDCRTRPARPERKRHRIRQAAALLDVPATPSRPLPTLAASLRALGVNDPAAIGRASAGPSDGARPRPRTGGPAASARHAAPPGATFRPAPAYGRHAGVTRAG